MGVAPVIRRIVFLTGTRADFWQAEAAYVDGDTCGLFGPCRVRSPRPGRFFGDWHSAPRFPGCPLRPYALGCALSQQFCDIAMLPALPPHETVPLNLL